MTLAFATFLFLYAVIWLFERKRMRVDAFRVGVAAVVPVASMLLVAMAAAFLIDSGGALMALSIAVLAIATFLTLWKVVGVSPLRSVIYVVAVIAFHSLIGVGILAIGMPDQTLYGDWEWPLAIDP